MLAQKAAEKPIALPRLRPDLVCVAAGTDDLGFPKIILSDPVRGAYFQLTWPVSAAVGIWNACGTVEALLTTLRRDFGAEPSPQELVEMVQFAQANQLTETDEEGGWRRYGARAAAQRRGILLWIVHNYLFFRIPMLRPDAALRALLPYFGIVFRPGFWVVLAILSVAGAYVSLGQWAELQAALWDALKFKTIGIYAAVLLGLKACHELGHGLTAARYGCRVPTMGIAFMLGTPVLYTDTTDSWRLSNRGDRLAIVFAGVAAEMIASAIALMLWPLLPDGAIRSVCFAIVTSALVSTIAVNLNPFMRYDGYFALSDYLRMPNLQTRAFALALWRLRELLFDLRRDPPERLPPGLQSTVVTYAVLTAIYRVTLYLGVAAVVYHVGSKALGLVLGGFEVVVFIALPVWHELTEWWKARDIIVHRNRIWFAASLPAAALALLLVPWSSSIEIPAVVQAKDDVALYLPVAGQIGAIRVREGQHVAAGDIIVSATSPDLGHQLVRAEAERATLQIEAERLNSSDRRSADRLVILSQLKRTDEEVKSLAERIEQLVVKAPISGTVVDLDPELSAGVWQDAKHPIARIVSPDAAFARGVVDDGELSRMGEGAHAVFVPDDPSLPSRSLTLAYIAKAGSGLLAEPLLAEKFGGRIAAVQDRESFSLKDGGVDVGFAVDGPAPATLVRGIVRLAAPGASPAFLIWTQLAKVLVREQGF